MSAVLGAISIPVIYLLCLQAGRHVTSDFWRPHIGALLGASLVAVHYTQVIAARTARMYSMGALLAGLSSWLLLNALHKERSCAWWLSYALTVAAFLYTHNYAMFTVFAQAVYAVGFLAVKARRCSLQWALRCALQLVTAGLIVLLIYCPWVPTLLGQARGVKQSYWIEKPSVDQTLRSLSAWTTGSPCRDKREVSASLCILGALLCYSACRTGFAGRFFVVQAVVPWLVSLSVSTYGGRSIFQERYLTFAQLSLFGAAAVAYASLRGRLERSTLAAAVLLVVALNLRLGVRPLSAYSAAPEEFMAFFEEYYAPTDEVLLREPAALNVFRYYMAQRGLFDVNVRCCLNANREVKRMDHSAAISANDVQSGNGVPEDVSRIWLIDGITCTTPPGMRLVAKTDFEYDGNHCAALYERCGREMTRFTGPNPLRATMAARWKRPSKGGKQSRQSKQTCQEPLFRD